MYLAHLLHSKLRESAKRGSGLAQALTHEGPRSPHWHTVEKDWVRVNGTSAACGGTTQLQVHHRTPFHIAPQIELADGTGRFCQARDPKTGLFLVNLITLCMRKGCECHLLIGHGGDFHRDNEKVADDAAELLAHPDRRDLIVARARAASLVGG